MFRKLPALSAAMACFIFGLGFGFSAAAAEPSIAQQRPRETAAPRATGVRQITLLVEDMDRTMDFYQRLGLTKTQDRTTEDGGEAMFNASDLPLTADPKTTRHVVMKGDGEGSAISLLSYDRPRLSSARGNLGGLGTGDVIITVEVADMQDAFRRLGQIGTRFQRTPYRFTFTAPNGAKQTVQRMLAFDPDGHLAEIVSPVRD
jgi:catechol 2,3-dioxygenase-like lactoylglutathione lyase family enzyme